MRHHARRLAAMAAWALVAACSPSIAADLAVHGAGATFPYPVYARWIAQYVAETGESVLYDPVGSGKGLELLEKGAVDFAGSDTPLGPERLTASRLTQFPAVIGSIVPVFNVSGVKSGALTLSGGVMADIYLGKIRKWNDAAIVAMNPGLALPNTYITVVHRRDASGSTALWSRFLSRSSPTWATAVGAGSLLSWPVGVAEEGNEGVAASVHRTRASIGYVEYAYAVAHGLSMASLSTTRGSVVQPGPAALTAAVRSVRWTIDHDLDQSMVDQFESSDAWPITSTTFIVLSTAPSADARNARTLRFFRWALRTGQRAAVDLDYVPMPAKAVELIERRWASLPR